MFKTIASKIFAAIAFVSVVTLVASFYSSSTKLLDIQETALLDNLTSSIEKQLVETDKTPIFQIPDGFGWIEKTTAGPVIVKNLSPAELQTSAKWTLPPTGVLVSVCHDYYFCASAFSERHQGWLIKIIKKLSRYEIWKSEILTFIPTFIILLAFALISSLLIARFLARPLKRLVTASNKVAAGDYEAFDLSQTRKDEIGELSTAFLSMAKEIKKREISLEEKAAFLAHSERLASIGQLGAGIAHEIKNPLLSLIGYAKLIEKQSSTPELKEAGEIIAKESQRCSDILNQLLRFSRNEERSNTWFTLQDVIDSTFALLKHEAQKKHLQLLRQCKGDLSLEGSPQKCQQILFNLIKNAIDASPENKKIIVEAFSEENQLTIKVIDEGPGIPDSIKPRIFDPFFSTKEKNLGTGLGLSLVHHLVESFAGQIYFISTPQVGTTFTIKMPRSLQSSTNSA